LSAAQQAALVTLPTAEHDLRLHYTLSEHDLAMIRAKRGPHNRLQASLGRVKVEIRHKAARGLAFYSVASPDAASEAQKAAAYL
jgi:hypothetical protein